MKDHVRTRLSTLSIPGASVGTTEFYIHQCSICNSGLCPHQPPEWSGRACLLPWRPVTRRGLKAWVGAGSRQLWPQSGPVCCSPTTPPPPGPEGCWAGLGPCPAPCWRCLCFAGTTVLLVRSSPSSALVSPLPGLGRGRWEKEVSVMPLGWKSPGGRLAWVWGDVLPTHPPADTVLPEQSPMDASILSPTSC